MFEIRFSNKSEKFLKKCDKKLKNKLKVLFEDLKKNPVPAGKYDLRKISGMEDTYRIRLSSVRMAYKVYFEEKLVRIIKIKKRKESTYKKLI